LWVPSTASGSAYNNGKTFEQYTNGYPSVSTYDLVIQEREADLVIATFGRALWVLDDIRPLRAMAKANGAVPTKKVTAFEPPVAYQAQYRNAPGYEWSTWGLYEGENRRRGAMLSFFVNPAADTSKAKTDSAFVKIFDEAGKQLRTLRVKADTGFNRFYWNFDTKGTRQPGQPKPRPGAPEQGGGFAAFPGTYKVVISMGKEADSTMVTVKADPRVEVKKEVYDAKKQMMERLQKSADQLTAALDRIADAEEAMTKLEGQLRGEQGKAADSLRKAMADVRKQIKTIRESISGRSAEGKQGITRFADRTTQTALQTARMEIMGKLAAPTAQTERLVKEAEDEVQKSVNQINDFFNTKWKAFRQHAEATPVKLFKE
jgi:hypothetical protein